MLKNISLDDKYKLENKFILVNGTQALVRATLIQKFRDEKENLKTAGFVTGYRGSPVGNVDLQFSKVKRLISEKDIKFHPGLNEDIAAGAVRSEEILYNTIKNEDIYFPGFYEDGIEFEKLYLPISVLTSSVKCPNVFKQFAKSLAIDLI